MGKKDKAHSANKKRTDVPKKEEQKSKKGKSGKGKDKTVEIKNAEKKNKLDKKRKKIKKAIRRGKEYIFCTITTMVLMFIFEKFGFVQLTGKCLAIIVALIKGVKVVIPYINKFVIYFTGQSITDIIEGCEKQYVQYVIEGLKFFKSILKCIGRCIHKFVGKEGRLKRRLSMLVIALIMAVIGSRFQFYARIAYAMENDIMDFFNYEERKCARLENDQEMAVVSVIHSKEESEDKVNNNMKNTQNEESLDTLVEEIINQLDSENALESENIIVTEEDRNRELNLSTSHYNDIFHQEGEFKIEDWGDQKAIDEMILKEVQDEVGLKKENKFDEDAPNGLKTDVNAASENEKKENTFSGRIEIMETRMDAYDSDPKSSLAKLVSNDNQALALALVQNDGKKQTEMYFYGESILWGREYIGFADVSASSVKEKLNWVAERYKDIRFICSEEDPEYLYADRLMKAYQHAANEF